MIFKEVDELEGQLASLQGGPREFKVESKALAVGATEIFGKVAIKNLATVLAKGLADQREAVVAGFTEGLPAIESAFAEFADRRVDKIENEIFHSRWGFFEFMTRGDSIKETAVCRNATIGTGKAETEIWKLDFCDDKRRLPT